VSTQLSSDRPRKQPANVYTIMLLMSMIFMLVAVVAMFMEMNRYAPDYHKTTSATPNVGN
jgi:hypothetical protein